MFSRNAKTGSMENEKVCAWKHQKEEEKKEDKNSRHKHAQIPGTSTCSFPG